HTREFLHSEDLSEAVFFVLQNVDFKDLYEKGTKEIQNTHLNIGTNQNITIKDLAYLLKKIVAFDGKIEFNTKRPNGALQKLSDCTKINHLGWQAKITLEQGVQMMNNNYVNNNGGGVNDLKFIFLNSFLIVYLFKDKLLKIQSNFFYLNFKIKPLNSISKIRKANGLKVA
ncbi:MAG: GDP-mannose 4,6-dehydratase, partial [Helicobacter sp.]|nr:GDP-mannose 4,6-dehydratase [Helicobacter sp.]